MNEKNTPRDFFLHIGAFIGLYFGAIALITLVFTVIDYKLPDPLQAAYYYDPYSGSIRFAIASLLVLTPLAVYLFSIIQKETRKDPERKTLGVRKWLTYVTLFVAGATVVGDIIALLNSFLGGELPTVFLLKVLTILAVTGVGFTYFFLDVKGYWLSRAAYSQYFGLGVLGVVLVAIVGGMALIGSPMTQRNLRVDNQQVSDLTNISQYILDYWQKTRALPTGLTQLESDITGYRLPINEAGTPYEYEKKTDLSFTLCATFVTDSTGSQTNPALKTGLPSEGPQWNHKAGYTCFTRTIDPKLFPPITDKNVIAPQIQMVQPVPVQ